MSNWLNQVSFTGRHTDRVLPVVRVERGREGRPEVVVDGVVYPVAGPVVVVVDEDWGSEFALERDPTLPCR